MLLVNTTLLRSRWYISDVNEKLLIMKESLKGMKRGKEQLTLFASFIEFGQFGTCNPHFRKLVKLLQSLVKSL